MDYSTKLKNHPSFTETENIKNICDPLKLFNISTFANARISKDNEFSSLCNYPDCLKHYLEQEYHMADISAKNGELNIGPYLMWDLTTARGKTQEMLNSAADFDYKHIFTIIKKQKNHTDYYHFGTHLNSSSINQWYVNNIDKLELFIDYFNKKVTQSKTLKLAYEITFPIIDAVACQIDTLNSAFNDALKSRNAEFMRATTTDLFSHRQYQCIELIIKGYSAKQIAKELDISYRTVEDHIQVVKTKLLAQNKTDLILKSLHYLKFRNLY